MAPDQVEVVRLRGLRGKMAAERRWRLKNVCWSLPAGSPPIPHDERGHIVALWLADRELADTAE